MTNKLQNYIGIAVRQCTGTIAYQLKKEIDAVLYHCFVLMLTTYKHVTNFVQKLVIAGVSFRLTNVMEQAFIKKNQGFQVLFVTKSDQYFKI